MKLRLVFGIAVLLLGIAQAEAQDLTVGSQGDPSLDPHYLYIGTNVAFWRHIYGSLMTHDNAGHPVAGIAESFRPIDTTTWEFKLRPDIRFKDGSTLTADDVVFSLHRVTSIPGNPSTYAPRLESITSVEAVDPTTVRIHTSVPNPYVPDNMVDIAIVSRKAVEGKTSGDFSSLKAVDEYGPYRVTSFAPGDHLVLERNETYWGEKPYWQKITFRVITNDASRVAALLSGDVDFIDFVPPTDVARLKADARFAVQDGPSGRMMVLLVNFRAGPIAGITGADGQPLQKNPLLDLRVRQAISKAIDRTGLVDRIMGGEAIPASQLTIPTMEGYDTALQVEKADPKGAKALLAEAGYPDGFGLDIACTNNRYPNDDRICQAVGQMLARAGFHAKVETMPISMLMPKLKGTPTQGDIALGMLGLSQGTHPTALTLMVHSADPAVGRGQYNFGEYDNPDMDRMIDQAFTTLDPAKREAAIREAVDRTMHEIVVVPLYFQKVITASRANLTYTTDPTEETLTWRIMPKAK